MMKFTVNESFWKDVGILAKIFLKIGFSFVHIGMKISGYEDGEFEQID